MKRFFARLRCCDVHMYSSSILLIRILISLFMLNFDNTGPLFLQKKLSIWFVYHILVFEIIGPKSPFDSLVL